MTDTPDPRRKPGDVSENDLDIEERVEEEQPKSRPIDVSEGDWAEQTQDAGLEDEELDR